MDDFLPPLPITTKSNSIGFSTDKARVFTETTIKPKKIIINLKTGIKYSEALLDKRWNNLFENYELLIKM